MINNRQGGRRRGRGGQRPQNLSGRPDGNRQDNRQRGNAAQLLEKYKSMARDAQLGGDRVQTEYYLQYAEHYYRVLGESRARFDEQRRARGEDVDDDGDDEQMEADDQRDEGGDDDRPDRNDRPQRNDRFERERPDGGERHQRAERTPRGPRYAGNDRNDRGDGDGANRSDGDGGDTMVAQESPKAARPPRNANRGDGDGGRPVESISFDALPPAIGRDVSADAADGEEAARPKRRVRKPRAAEDDGDIAPAA